MSTDPQVALLEKIPEPQSLFDSLLRKYNASNRDPANPFFVRLLISGKKSNELTVGQMIEGLAENASGKADKSNPFVNANSQHLSINSVLIDYGTEFILLIEGPERHIYGLVDELRETAESELKDVLVLFFADDVEPYVPKGWLIVDKVPPASLSGAMQEKSDEEIGDSVLHDLASLRELGIACGEVDKHRRGVFADNAKINYPKLFPKSCNVDMYIESELFLTIAEFQQNITQIPDSTRTCEITHPMEQPLQC